MTLKHLMISTAVLVLSCGPIADPSTSESHDTSKHATGAVATQSCSAPPLAGPSEACCVGHGVDACGANLFCAALDGRTLATCYVTRSQPAGAECGEDSYCQSEACSDDGFCRALPGQSCAGGESCHNSVCDDDICVPTTGEFASVCEEDSHCQEGHVCEGRQCVNDVGAGCGSPRSYGSGACATRFCEQSGLSALCGECGSDAECEDANGMFEVCEQGKCVHTCQNDGHCELMNINCGGHGLTCAFECVDGICRQ